MVDSRVKGHLDPNSCSIPLTALFYGNLTLIHNTFFEICKQEIKVLVHAEMLLDWSWDIATECLRPEDVFVVFCLFIF